MEPVKLIIDTDIGPDCDDAGALACAHALQSQGRCQLLAVTHCTSNPYGGACIDAINRWYGCGDIPVGTLGREGFLSDPEHMKYNRYIAGHYPNRYASEPAPDAVAVLRRTLAGQADGSVTMCAIGPLSNLADLLLSGPDEVSELNGLKLVARKVRLLVDMGGGLAEAEWNLKLDRDAADLVCSWWPGEVWFSIFEVGATIITGRAWQDGRDNPIADAYRLYSPQGRMSWDQTAVLAAVLGEKPWFTLSEPGIMAVTEDGTSVFTPSAGGNRRILHKAADDVELESAIDALMHWMP